MNEKQFDNEYVKHESAAARSGSSWSIVIALFLLAKVLFHGLERIAVAIDEK